MTTYLVGSKKEETDLDEKIDALADLIIDSYLEKVRKEADDYKKQKKNDKTAKKPR